MFSNTSSTRILSGKLSKRVWTSGSRAQSLRFWVLFTIQLYRTLPAAFDVKLPVLKAPWPVFLQQPGHCPVREQPAVILASRTVVAFVLGIDDPLDGRATVRTRFAIPAVNGHTRPKRGHFGWEFAAGLVQQPRGPLVES